MEYFLRKLFKADFWIKTRIEIFWVQDEIDKIAIIWFQVFLSNANNLHTVKWFQVTNNNNNNNP